MTTQVNSRKIVLLHWNGRFGNRLFTYAFLRYWADLWNLDVWLPSHWEGSVLFDNSNYKVVEDNELRLYLNQTVKELDNLDARLAAIQRFNIMYDDNIIYMNPDTLNPVHAQTNVCIDSLCCYNPSVFLSYSKKTMLDVYFKFSDKILQSDLYRRMEDRQGTYSVAHLRRDDIADWQNITNQGYSVISKESYEKAFLNFGYDPKKVEWVTDDKSGKHGIKLNNYQDNWNYPEGSAYIKDIFFSWLPDFLKLKFAKAVFRANSSFSWWASFLSDAEIYSPRLHARVLYHQTGRELDVEFEKGNHPHWMCVKGLDQCDDIIIK